MATETFLAMTVAEMDCCNSLPPKIGWMACHFSPDSPELCDLPSRLPPGSLLILDDSIPMGGHDPARIAAQLEECVKNLQCVAVLLDFQRNGSPETAVLAEYLAGALPCPVAVSESYGKDLDCPIFLPPLPHHVPLRDYLAPWQGREIWLELALDAEQITLTESGADISPLSPGEVFTGGHRDEMLHCHYTIALSEDEAKFTLWRTREDLDALLEEAGALGIAHTVGLYQELADHTL